MNVPARYTKEHANPQGPGDARPTALQIVHDEYLLNGLQGKTVLVTGGNDGSGLETARALHMTGARTFITARSSEKGEKAVQSIIQSNGGEKGGIEAVIMELDDLKSIRAAAQDFVKRSHQLNVLVLSAGVFPKELTYTKDGYESCIGANYLGNFFFIQLLQPLLLKSSSPEFHSRIVVVSSTGHRLSQGIDYTDFEPKRDGKDSGNPYVRYGHSKLAGVWMANQIERLYGSQGLHAWSLQPGGMRSTMVVNLGFAPPLEDPHFGPCFKSPEQGAATSVWAAISKDLEGKGGRYLESVEVVGPYKGPDNQLGDFTAPGYGQLAYNPQEEKKLWDYTENLLKEIAA